MRIGIDARSLAEPYPTGISTYTTQTIQALANLGTNDTFCLFSSGRSRPAQQFAELQQHKNIEWHHLAWPNKVWHAAAYSGVSPTIDRLLGGVDVLFAPNLHFLPVSANVPLVLTMHDLSFVLYPQFLSWQRRLWHQAVQPGKTLHRAQQVITVSNSTRQDVMQQYDLPANQVVTIYSGVPDSVPAEPLPGLPDKYVLFLSTLEPRKNLITLLDAFALFRRQHPTSPLELVVIGSPGWKSTNVVKRLHTTAGVHYFGYVTPGQKTAALQHAQALVYPSIYEGFGLPPLEALRWNVPVLASRVGALPEVLGEAALYVDPYAVVDWAQALYTIATDEQLRQTLIAAGKNRLGQFDWHTTAEQTLRVLHQAVY